MRKIAVYGICVALLVGVGLFFQDTNGDYQERFRLAFSQKHLLEENYYSGESIGKISSELAEKELIFRGGSTNLFEERLLDKSRNIELVFINGQLYMVIIDANVESSSVGNENSRIKRVKTPEGKIQIYDSEVQKIIDDWVRYRT